MTDKQWRIVGWGFVVAGAAWFVWFARWLFTLPWVRS